MTIAETQIQIRKMVDDYIREHNWDWDKYREQKEKEKGYSPGRSLSFQSHIGTDLLIDFCFLAARMENEDPFVNEYWIRSHGTQCLKKVEDYEVNKSVWSDVLAKFIVVFDGKEVTKIEWIHDDDCCIKNRFCENDEDIYNLSWSALAKSK